MVIKNKPDMLADWADLKDRKVGDVFVLAGHRVRLVKKTTTAIAVEAYTWHAAIENKIIIAIEWAVELGENLWAYLRRL